MYAKSTNSLRNPSLLSFRKSLILALAGLITGAPTPVSALAPSQTANRSEIKDAHTVRASESSSSGMEFFEVQGGKGQNTTEEPQEYLFPPGVDAGLMFQTRPVKSNSGRTSKKNDRSTIESSGSKAKITSTRPNPDSARASGIDSSNGKVPVPSSPGQNPSSPGQNPSSPEQNLSSTEQNQSSPGQNPSSPASDESSRQAGSGELSLGDIAPGSSSGGEEVSEDVLQGFVGLLDERQAPKLKAMNATMDDPSAKLEAMARENNIKLNAAATSINSVDDKKRAVAAAVERHGTTGVYISSSGAGYWTVIRPLPGGPSEAAGVRPGDRILAINGMQATGIDMTNAHHRLTGRRGEVKVFTIDRGGQRLNIPVRLWNIHEIRNHRSQYIEYYWFLLYNGYVSAKTFERLIKPYRY